MNQKDFNYAKEISIITLLLIFVFMVSLIIQFNKTEIECDLNINSKICFDYHVIVRAHILILVVLIMTYLIAIRDLSDLLKSEEAYRKYLIK